jgi:hypothetical protein
LGSNILIGERKNTFFCIIAPTAMLFNVKYRPSWLSSFLQFLLSAT